MPLNLSLTNIDETPIYLISDEIKDKPKDESEIKIDDECKILKQKILNYKKISCDLDNKLLGFGGFGSVYEYNDKIIKLKKVDILKDHDQFNNELFCSNISNMNLLKEEYNLIFQEINSSNLVNKFLLPKFKNNFIQKHEDGICSNTHKSYIIYDKVNGVTLDKYLKSIETDKEINNKIICIYLQLVYLLCYMNINGIYHRDIKPGNIMITHKKGTMQFTSLNNINMTINCDEETPIVVLIDYGLLVSFKLPTENPLTKSDNFNRDKQCFPIEHGNMYFLLNNIIKEKKIDILERYNMLFKNNQSAIFETMVPNLKDFNPHKFTILGEKINRDYKYVMSNIFNLFEDISKTDPKNIKIKLDNKNQQGGKYKLYYKIKYINLI